MAFSDAIFYFALNLMAQTQYAGIFVLMAMESATLPVPSEVVLPLAGFLVFQGRIEFWAAVVAATLGSLLGTTIDYAVGYYFGRPAILRYGRFFRLNEHHLARSEAWFTKYGNPAVFLARFVPLVRTVIAFPAGLARMSLGKFLAFSAVGIFLWDLILIYLGVIAGQNSNLIINSLESAFIVIEVAAVAVLLLAVFLFSRRQRKKAGS